MAEKQSSPTLSSVAARYINYTESRLFEDVLHEPKELVKAIKSLAASVLSQDEIPQDAEIIKGRLVDEQGGVLDGPDGAEYQGEGADAEKEVEEAEVVVQKAAETPEE